MKEEIAHKYLEEILKFKARKELHEGFIPAEKRAKLLFELAKELGFSKDTISQINDEARGHYSAYTMLEADSELKEKLPATVKNLLEAELLAAINSDPFNEEYLKEYIFSAYDNWKPAKEMKLRYLSLFNPSSNEFSNKMVDLGLSLQDQPLNYFEDELISPFVNELVFIEEVNQIERSHSEADYKKIAESAGVNESEITELNEEINNLLRTVETANYGHHIHWPSMHKAVLVVDRITGLAPYNRKVIYAALYFYGKMMWRLCLDSIPLSKSTEGMKAFYQSYLGKEKPSKVEKISAAKHAMEKAKSLADQFYSLPITQIEKSEQERIREMIEQAHAHGFNNEILDKSQVKVLVETQEIAYRLRILELEFQKKNRILGWTVGVILFIALLVFAILNPKLFIFSILLIMIPMFIGMGTSAIRAHFWKKKIHGI